jgi:ACS family glucarate transporter-like MFS transporter
LIFAGVGFGAGVTPPIITYLMVHAGWRASFWVSSLLGLAVGAIWFAVARNTPAEHPRVSAAEKLLIRNGMPAGGAVSAHLPLSSLVRSRDLLVVTFSYFCYGYTAYIFFSWFFIYLSSVRGLNLEQSSYYSMLPFLAMAVASAGGGWMSDQLTSRYGKKMGRCWFAAAATAMAAIFVAAGTQAASAQLASVVLAGGAGSLYLSQSAFWSISADIGKRSAGSVSGVMNMGSQLGGALTASATPAIADRFGWTASFLVAAALCAAGALAWMAVNPDAGERQSTGS